MKRLLILLLSFLLFAGSYSQSVITATSPYRTTVVASGYCAEYQAIYNAMTTKPSAGHATAQNAFVVAAKAHGYWSILDLFYFHAQDANTASEALICWIIPASYAFTNTGPAGWTTLQGFLGKSTSPYPYLVSQFYLDGATNFKQNSASFGAYCRTSGATGTNHVLGSYYDSDYANYLSIPEAGTNMLVRVNSTGAATTSATVAASTGFFVANRTSSSVIKVYRNGSKIGNDISNTSTTVPHARFTGLASSGNYCDVQIAMLFVGGAMTDQQVADFNTDFETLMDALGTGVE